MPRTRTHSIDELLDRALDCFWHGGYHQSSMGDLLEATGSNRHSLYALFGNKCELFLAVLDHYQRAVVDPAFTPVEQPGATLEDIAKYLEFQIDLAERSGLPGPGCLVANTMTELAPHDSAVDAAVNSHNQRLHNGFMNAISNSSGLQCKRRHRPDDNTTPHFESLAKTLMVFTQGLWSQSRTCTDAAELRRSAATMLQLIEQSL